MKKRKGAIMIEVLIVLCVLSILILYNTKLIVSKSSKLKFYEIKEDILTINDEEYDLLKEFINQLESSEELYQKFKNYKDDTSYFLEYKYSKNNNLMLTVKDGRIFAKSKISNTSYIYKEIACILPSEENEDIKLIPKGYKVVGI